MASIKIKPNIPNPKRLANLEIPKERFLTKFEEAEGKWLKTNISSPSDEHINFII